jgi:hypothetical protein
MTVAPAPPRQLRRQGADGAEHAVYQHGDAGDRPVGEHGPVRGDARDAQAGADVVADVVGQVDGLAGGNHGQLSRRAERPLGLGPNTHTRRPIRPWSTPAPTASITPAPSLCGMMREHDDTLSLRS